MEVFEVCDENGTGPHELCDCGQDEFPHCAFCSDYLNPDKLTCMTEAEWINYKIAKGL
jgi:hypothetical protein